MLLSRIRRECEQPHAEGPFDPGSPQSLSPAPPPLILDTRHPARPPQSSQLCQSHDEPAAGLVSPDRPSGCFDLDPASRPVWCSDVFCYVDPKNCAVPHWPTEFFRIGSSVNPSGNLYYSYAVCAPVPPMTRQGAHWHVTPAACR